MRPAAYLKQHCSGDVSSYLLYVYPMHGGCDVTIIHPQEIGARVQMRQTRGTTASIVTFADFLENMKICTYIVYRGGGKPR